MTYQEQIEYLLKESTQKSEAYIATLRIKRKTKVPAEAATQDKVYKEWEAAENAYTKFLISIKMQRINPNDVMAS